MIWPYQDVSQADGQWRTGCSQNETGELGAECLDEANEFIFSYTCFFGLKIPSRKLTLRSWKILFSDSHGWPPCLIYFKDIRSLSTGPSC